MTPPVAAPAGPTWPPKFESFRKIPRLNREIVITEKIDGTNALVVVPEDPGLPLAIGSRNRWITPGKGTDNYDFAAFVMKNEEAMRRLGPGGHYGEWWGAGIARKYGLTERRWSLFNTSKWTEEELRARDLPANVRVVPTLYRGSYGLEPGDGLLPIHNAIMMLSSGSRAEPGFDKPEGIVLYHLAAGAYFKWTFGGDGVSVRKAPSPIENA